MFVVGKERRAWWPVKWNGAAEDGGEIVENRIEMQFRVLDVDQIDALSARAAELDAEQVDGKPLVKSVAFAKLVLEIATNWRGVGAENGAPLPWGEDNLRLLMAVPTTFAATFAAWRDCIAGRAETRAGN